MDPGSPVSPHLRRRRDREAEQQQHDPDHAQPIARFASLERSANGARSGPGARSSAGGAPDKDKASLHGAGGAAGQAEAEGEEGVSPKIAAYHGPVGSITKHYFVANYNMDTDAMSASSAPKSLDEKSSVHSDTPLIPPREWINTHAYIQGLTLALLVGVLALSLFNVIKALLMLQAWYAVFVFGLVPLGVIFFSFAAGCAIKGVFSLLLGGTSPMDRNSQNYSAIKTPIPPGAQLPQIVVQMPVYKESLEEVIVKTYDNVKRAMDYYRAKGGAVKFIVCDDGFQVVGPEEASARTHFYESRGIAFVARPKLGRRGVFKKASNLNYQLAISDKVGQLMAEQGLKHDQALLKVWEEMDREFVAAGDLTMDDGCLILLIDADTKVPEHCMYDVVGEFIESPEVAYTQHFTTPFDEQCRNYWEQHVSAFTRIIYFQGIAMSVAFGDCAPLVGHNAFLRWAYVKKVGYTDEFCRFGETKYWSECSVSEDFDLYIRLASNNMFGRYVMYTGPDFQEGVSLTYMDEAVKLEKFAYGACEMIFNPFKLWLTQSPFNDMFRKYLANKHIKWYQKASMLTYLSSYLAMASAFYYVVFEGVMSIIDPKFHDYFIPHSFDIMLTGLVIFSGIGTVCGGIIFQWRRTAANRQANMFKIVWEQLKWLPTTIIFFNSVLFSMTKVCAVYFLGMNVTWGATAKETSSPSCFKALRDTLVGYRWEYCVYCSMLAAYSICMWHFNVGLYRSWAVMSFCCGHILGPILLNPAIMSLAY